MVTVNPQVGVGLDGVEQDGPMLVSDDGRQPRSRGVGSRHHSIETGRTVGRELGPARGGVIELETGGVEEQTRRRHTAVFGVTDDGHAQGGGVDPHLMGPSGVRPGSVAFNLGANVLTLKVRHRILAGSADPVIAPKRVGAAIVTGDNELIALGQRAGLELSGERLVGRRRLAKHQEPRGHLVQPMEDRE